MTNFPPAQRALTEDSLGKTVTPLIGGKVPTQYLPAAETTTPTTPSPITEGFEYLIPISRWNAGIRRRNTAPCLFLPAGSSTTAGQAATSEANRYVNKVVAAIQAAYPKADGSAHPATIMASASTSSVQGAGIRGINYGVSSTTSVDFITQADITKMVAQSATGGVAHLFWMVGSNDWSRDIAPSAFKANMATWISRAKTAFLAANKPFLITLVATYGRVDSSAQTPPKNPWSSYVTAMRELALAEPNYVAFMDLSNIYKFAGMPESGTAYDPFDLLTSDDVHQNDLGHDFMADEILKKLNVPRGVMVGGTTPVTPVTPAPTFNLLTTDGFGTASTTMTARKTDAALGGNVVDVLSGTPDAFKTVGGFLVPGATRAGVETYGLDVGTPDGVVEVKVDSVTGGSVWIDFRAASTAATSIDTYRLVLSTDNTFQVSKRPSGGTNALLGTAVALPAGETWISTPHTFRIEYYGSTIKVYLNGSSTPAIDLTDATFTAGNYVRLTSTSAANFSYDYIKAYTTNTVTPTTPTTPPASGFSVFTSDGMSNPQAVTIENHTTDAALGGTPKAISTVTPTSFGFNGSGSMIPGATRTTVETFGVSVDKPSMALEATISNLSGGSVWLDVRAPSTAVSTVGTYRLACTTGNTIQLVKRPSGGTSQNLGAAAPLGGGWTTPRQVRIEVTDLTDGSVLLKAYLNGTEVASYTDTTSPITTGNFGRITTTSASTYVIDQVIWSAAN